MYVEALRVKKILNPKSLVKIRFFNTLDIYGMENFLICVVIYERLDQKMNVVMSNKNVGHKNLLFRVSCKRLDCVRASSVERKKRQKRKNFTIGQDGQNTSYSSCFSSSLLLFQIGLVFLHVFGL